jgi:P pilus assembly chaperone PapD
MYTSLLLHYGRYKHYSSLFLSFLVTVSAVLMASSVSAQGNLMITPRRVLFEGSKKTQELNLANTGKDTARYLISMIEIRMKEDGTFEQIAVPDSGQQFASNYVRFFPRSVTLGPGEVQTVKVQVVRQGQLMAGEYRSHIYFRAVADEKPLGEVMPVKDSTGISVQLKPVFGISIPLIIREGETSAEVKFSNTSFETAKDGTPILSTVFNRTGNASAYGDIRISFISAAGKNTVVGKVKGIAVYTPTSSRRVKIALDKVEGIDYKSGKLLIEYMTSDAQAFKIAETELPLL